MSDVIQTEVVVLGSGPGGYTAAFRAADLGKKTILVERYAELGGVCLNVGCIPSKALLHAARVMDEAAHLSVAGIQFGTPKIELSGLRSWKNKVIARLTSGLKGLSKQRKVQVVQGEGRFADPHTLVVKTEQGEQRIRFENAIIAAGSRPVVLPFLPSDPRIVDSTGALELPFVPKRMLVIGGGIIGLEMATVYAALGSEITVVEMSEGLIPAVDRDVMKPFMKRLQTKIKNIWTSTKVISAEAKKDAIWVRFEGAAAPQEPVPFDLVLVAVGRIPNGGQIGADQAGVQVDGRGFIATDTQMRTNVPHIFAIGDIVGNPMLAHKAIPEGRVAAEVIAGEKHYFEPKVIASVAYTDPEIAWVGLTEQEAKSQGVAYRAATFPWAASGRALAMGREEGLTKLLFDPVTHKVLGASIVGVNAGDLIAEVAFAIEMGAEAGDLALTIHPHPTLSETVALSAEIFEGTITDLYFPKKQ